MIDHEGRTQVLILDSVAVYARFTKPGSVNRVAVSRLTHSEQCLAGEHTDEA